MVNEKRRAYMKEYMRRKRAKEKLFTKSAPPVSIEGLKFEEPRVEEPKIDFNICQHCRSKDISRKGNIVSCRRCGISYDVTVGFVRNVIEENEF